MRKLLRDKSMRATRLHGALAALLLAASGAAMPANVTVNLCATTGSMVLPGTATAVNIQGYALGACSPATSVTVPIGPVIDVNVGDVVTVNLQNKLTKATGLLFQGQSMLPDTTGAAAATPSAFGTKSYTFTAGSAGTFLYEAAPLPNTEHQAAMGMHGALIVRPAPVAFTGIRVGAPAAAARIDATATYTSGSTLVLDTSAVATDIGSGVSGAGIRFGATITAVTPGTSFTMSAPALAAYGAESVVNDEAVLVLSELDPALNGSADPATFDMRNFAPRYFLINGQPYPNTAPVASAPGNKVLLRYVNAGAKHHSMGVLGLRQVFVAKDAGLLPTRNHNVAAETIAPGQTGDAIATVPTTVTTASRFAVYDASLALHNNGADNAFGGMLTFVTAGTGAANAGPKTMAVVLTPSSSAGAAPVSLTASVDALPSTVTAAEYFIDATGAAGSGSALTATFGAATVTASGTLSVAQLAALASGNHTVFVHGKDATGKWGAFSSAVLILDKTGPATTGVSLTPNPSGGTVSVVLRATGSDSATGGSNVTAAEYFRGAPGANGSGTAMAVNIAAPVASLTATLAPPVAAGVISVHSMDAYGNWGAFATVTLNVVAAGPVTSAVSASRNPNNGALPLNSTQAVVRVTATMTSTGSSVGAAEVFIDAVGATGTGVPLVPSDGSFNAAAETGYADLPLATIGALAAGNHTVSVRGRDALGNWGATSTTILVIDKAAPTIGSVTLTPNTVVLGAASTALVVSATDNIGVTGGQYWIDGSATPPAAPAGFTTSSAAVGTGALAAGTHTVYVRVQDAAGNWSAVAQATLYVLSALPDPVAITSNTNTAPQVSNPTSVLANDQPIGLAGRTATLATGPVRVSGGGATPGTIAITCGAAPAGICADGTYRITLTPAGAGPAARAASKRGTYRFTYTETLNGVTTPPATVTITVN